MYKDKVPVLPVAMVDATLGVSVCGYRTTKINTFLNTRNSIMGLQYGCEKCEKIHWGNHKMKTYAQQSQKIHGM